jgi:hypothetical protein
MGNKKEERKRNGRTNEGGVTSPNKLWTADWENPDEANNVM